MTKKAFMTGVVCGAALYAFAVPASAQDDAGTATAPESGKKSDRDAAVQTMPAWESYGVGGEESLEETFFRLSRDFVSTSELGVRRLGAVPIWPRGELKFGPVRILPYLREALEYDSNLYFQPDTGDGAKKDGRETGWTHVNELGAMADMALAGGRARISASANSIWSVRYRDDQPDEWTFDSQLGGSYHFPSGFWISGGVAWERRSDAADYSDVGRKFARTNRRGFLNWGFDRDILFGSKAKFEMGVSVRNVQAREKPFDNIDRQETQFFAKVSYPFWKKTTRVFLLSTYRIDARQSAALNDGQTGGLQAGIEGSIPLSEGDGRGIRGQVSMGFDSSLYDNGTYTRGSKRFVSDPNRRNTSLSFQAALQYVMSSRTTMDLRFLRTNQFSLHGNYQITDRLDLSASHNFTRKLTGRISAFLEHSDPSGLFNPETVDGPTAQTRNATPVNTTGIGTGFRYAYNEWMDFDASFDIQNRNAQEERSGKDYRGILGVTVYLNALTPRPRQGAER